VKEKALIESNTFTAMNHTLRFHQSTVHISPIH